LPDRLLEFPPFSDPLALPPVFCPPFPSEFPLFDPPPEPPDWAAAEIAMPIEIDATTSIRENMFIPPVVEKLLTWELVPTNEFGSFHDPTIAKHPTVLIELSMSY